MTKKELFDELKNVPDDTEIVFGTNKNLLACVPLNMLNISIIQQCTNEPINGDIVFSPKYKTSIVLDAIPYWYLKVKYNITFNTEE